MGRMVVFAVRHRKWICDLGDMEGMRKVKVERIGARAIELLRLRSVSIRLGRPAGLWGVKALSPTVRLAGARRTRRQLSIEMGQTRRNSTCS